MKKLLLAVLFLALLILIPSASFAVTSWYAQNSSVNINSASEWNDNPAGGGNVLTWGNQVAGDTFYANGKTAIAVNVDPGANGKVTLTTAAGGGTTGGGFTYATATNITINSDITAGTTTCLAVTGSTGGLTVIGNIQGGAVSTTALSTTHTSVTLNIGSVGTPTTITGGTSATGYGVNSLSAGPIAIIGNVLAATGSGLNNYTGTTTITGNCVGTTTSAPAVSAGNTTGSVTIVGNLINGTKGSAASGSIIYNPGPLNYIQYPAPAATTIYLPKAPAVTDVKSGVQYGYDGANPLTGTYGGGGGGGAWGF